MHHYLNAHKLSGFVDKLKQRIPQTMVALGDSNTANHHFSGGFKQWPELLQTELRMSYDTQYLTLVNAGVCGDTALDGLGRLQRDVLRFAPDVVVVTFGTNDCLKEQAAQFEPSMCSIIEQLQQAGAAVVVRTVPPIMERLPPPDHIWKDNVNLQTIIASCRTLAQRYELCFADIYGLWEELERGGSFDLNAHMQDEVHTNAAGHKLIARQLMGLFGLAGDSPRGFVG
jgi:lysophospholipase L1-like esterase